MVGWTLLLVLILAGLIFLLLQRIYYEHKIKMARRGLAGKVCRALSCSTTTTTTTSNSVSRGTSSKWKKCSNVQFQDQIQ